MSKCVIVTGVPYSGKAIVAGVLHYLGVHMGDFVIKGKEEYLYYGPYDGYEDSFFINFHIMITNTRTDDDILSIIRECADDGKRFTYPTSPDEASISEEKEDGDAIAARRMLAENVIDSLSNDYPLWGVQEPRLCVPSLFDEFVDAIQGYCEPMLIVMDRLLLDSAYSYDRPEEELNEVLESLMIYQSVRNEIFYNFRGEKLMVSFDDTILNPLKVIGDITNFIGVEPTEAAYGFLLERKGFLASEECWFSEAEKYRKIIKGVTSG